MKHLEHKLQCSCIKYFRYAYPVYSKLLFSIPNGGSRNIIEAVKLKKEGVLAGCADLFLSVPNSFYHGFYIEMKYGKNKQSENQKIFQKEVEAVGYKYSLCYSFDEFEILIKYYLK